MTDSPSASLPEANVPASRAAFERAAASMPGGVSSPVRAFKAVGGVPRFVQKARGARVWDVDGNGHVDLVCSWGAILHGHALPEMVEAVREAAAGGASYGAPTLAEAELAEEIIGAVPGLEMLRFVNSGTEAGMSAIRLARAATGRNKLVKFAGCYHGHADALLVAAGSGAATFGTPSSPGVPPAVVADTLLAEFNDLASVEAIAAEHGDSLAAILVEPLAGNMGFVRPKPGFLEGLRAIADKTGALLVFDEVMTGFRVALGGMAGLSGVRPDVFCFAKVIGGGFPVGAYGASKAIMEQVSPCGPVYQAGTLSGNPVAMAAGLLALRLCKAEGLYEKLGATSRRLAEGFQSAADAAGVPLTTDSQGGMFGASFRAEPVENFTDAQACDHAAFSKFFHAMLRRGVWLPPSSYEAMFVSAAHGDEEIEHVLSAARESFAEIAG